MKVNLKTVAGPWNHGVVLDKHTVSSTCVGNNEYGHPVFNTVRTEIGEAAYLLKYRGRRDLATPLAKQILESAVPLFGPIGLIVPSPPSKARAVQPVFEIAEALGRMMGVPVFERMLRKSAGPALKDLHSKEDKAQALKDRIQLQEQIVNDGRWNVLLVDDLFDTGATAEAACGALRRYDKIADVYFAALTWK